MTPITRERLAFNITNAPKRHSVKAVWAAGALATIFASLTDDQRDAMLHALPVNPVWLPLIGAVVLFIVQMWPQFNLPKPPEPSDAAVAQTVDEAVPASATPKTVTMPTTGSATVNPSETVAERREREDRELAERRAAEDAELASAEKSGPLTEFAIESHDDDTVLEAIRQLAPNISERNLEKIRFRTEQLRLEKLKPTTKG